MTTQAASVEDRGAEARLRALQAVARAVELIAKAAELRAMARQRADRARADAAAAHVRAARAAEAAAARRIGDVDGHRRRAAEHRVAVLKASLRVVSSGRSFVDRGVLVELSALAQRRTPVRESVYRLLVGPPLRPWTVGELFREMDGTRPQRADTVREIVYVLLADGALTSVKGTRTLTIQMTAPGEVALRNLLGSWATAPV